jgi:hypothetical protein
VRALILAGGDRPDPALLDAHWPGWRSVSLVVAADGGARHAAPLGLPLHQVVGDFDSLSASDVVELEAAGVTVTRFPTNKDATIPSSPFLRHLMPARLTSPCSARGAGAAITPLAPLHFWRTRAVAQLL